MDSACKIAAPEVKQEIVSTDDVVYYQTSPAHPFYLEEGAMGIDESTNEVIILKREGFNNCFIISILLLITSSIYTLYLNKPQGYSFRVEKMILKIKN